LGCAVGSAGIGGREYFGKAVANSPYFARYDYNLWAISFCDQCAHDHAGRPLGGWFLRYRVWLGAAF